MSLLEAAREDVATAIRQEVDLQNFASGLSKGGRGPTQKQRQAKAHKVEMKRATAYASELNVGGAVDKGKKRIFVPEKGKHRPPEKRKITLSALSSSEGPLEKHTVPSHPLSSQTAERSCHVVVFRTVINLKRCYGCKKQFTKKHKTEPNDIVLQHFC